jgi:hypothetical protein
VALQRAARSATPRPRHVAVRDDIDDAQADLWFSYFAQVVSSAGTWASGPFGLVFQRDRLVPSGRIEHRPEALYPDLSEIGVQTALDGDRPALRLSAAHPYARGFVADGKRLAADILPLELRPGEHELTLSVRTDYGALPGKQLRYQVAAPP